MQIENNIINLPYEHARDDTDYSRLLQDATRTESLAFCGMLMDLQELLGRNVDLIEEGSLRPYAAETATRDNKLIYERVSY